jgi:hypothetical protein
MDIGPWADTDNRDPQLPQRHVERTLLDPA